MREPFAFFALFGVLPGLSAYVSSGRNDWKLIAGLWVGAGMLAITMTLFPMLLESLPGYSDADGSSNVMDYRPVGWLALMAVASAKIGKKCEGKAPQWLVAAGVAAIGLAIGASLIYFGVIG